MFKKYKNHRIGSGFGAVGPIIGRVWNAKNATFDGRDWWMGAIESWTKLIVVSGDEIDGTKQSAIEFVITQAQQKFLGPIDIFVRD